MAGLKSNGVENAYLYSHDIENQNSNVCVLLLILVLEGLKLL